MQDRGDPHAGDRARHIARRHLPPDIPPAHGGGAARRSSRGRLGPEVSGAPSSNAQSALRISSTATGAFSPSGARSDGRGFLAPNRDA
jgi:hypothetical protein